MDAKEIEKALRLRHPSPEWVCLAEMRCGTGFKDKNYNPQRRMDLFVMNMFPSKNFHRICYEIKVSKSDFLSEISNPKKRMTAVSLVNEFYFITPKGLVSPSEIPSGCGLIEVSPRKKTCGVVVPYRFKTLVKAGFKEALLPLQFVAAIARRAK